MGSCCTPAAGLSEGLRSCRPPTPRPLGLSHRTGGRGRGWGEHCPARAGVPLCLVKVVRSLRGPTCPQKCRFLTPSPSALSVPCDRGRVGDRHRWNVRKAVPCAGKCSCGGLSAPETRPLAAPGPCTLALLLRAPHCCTNLRAIWKLSPARPELHRKHRDV